jgi:ribose 1,5-bisphosphokinase
MSRLIYTIGASGVGKDTLLLYARRHINGSLPLLFAHRYITRPATDGSENHISLSNEEFLLRKEKGLFAMDWESHQLYYGVGREIDDWMAKGCYVIVNGSRGYLEIARSRYPDMTTIIIEADPVIISQRLAQRGREDAQDISSRIQRQPSLPDGIEGLVRITNNGLPEEGGNTLVEVIYSLLMVR